MGSRMGQMDLADTPESQTGQVNWTGTAQRDRKKDGLTKKLQQAKWGRETQMECYWEKWVKNEWLDHKLRIDRPCITG